MHRIVNKWRPPLAVVIGGTLAVVLTLPIFGIVYLRLWGNVLGWGETAWLIGWMAVIATVILGFLLWRLVLRPVYALTRYARAMKAGAPAPAPTHFGTPEFSRLGASVMAMGDSLHNRAEGLQAYADHVTHELTSPLTAIRGAAELLEADGTQADREALNQTIRDAARRMQTLLDALSHHAHAATASGPGSSLVSEAVLDVDAALEVVVAQDGPVPMARRDLHTILTQLARNAAEHGATRLTVSAMPGGLCISDNGPGISPGNRDRVFDPFFTTRREQGGTGMGLSIVRSLVQARGGQVSLTDDAQGATFTITFD